MFKYLVYIIQIERRECEMFKWSPALFTCTISVCWEEGARLVFSP